MLSNGHIYICSIWASPVTQTVKGLPAIQETQVQSLGREDRLAEDMAPGSSMLAWRIPWTEEPRGLQSVGSQRVLGTKDSTSLSSPSYTYIDRWIYLPT